MCFCLFGGTVKIKLTKTVEGIIFKTEDKRRQALCSKNESEVTVNEKQQTF